MATVDGALHDDVCVLGRVDGRNACGARAPANAVFEIDIKNWNSMRQWPRADAFGWTSTG